MNSILKFKYQKTKKVKPKQIKSNQDLDVVVFFVCQISR